MSKADEPDWIKIDLHIHTLDDPKDAIDFSAHQLLERARSLGFRVLAITLHDAVFDRKEVFADAAAMGILLIPAAEVRLLGADVIVLNVSRGRSCAAEEFRRSAAASVAPRQFCFYDRAASVLRLWRLNRIAANLAEIDCFDAIEYLPFSFRAIQSESWRKKSGSEVRETVNRHFRRASAACLWPALHDYAHAACAHD